MIRDARLDMRGSPVNCGDHNRMFKLIIDLTVTKATLIYDDITTVQSCFDVESHHRLLFS